MNRKPAKLMFHPFINPSMLYVRIDGAPTHLTHKVNITTLNIIIGSDRSTPISQRSLKIKEGSQLLLLLIINSPSVDKL